MLGDVEVSVSGDVPDDVDGDARVEERGDVGVAGRSTSSAMASEYGSRSVEEVLKRLGVEP
ncbi:MAG TPA: hypothetical protein VFG59_20805 [Anaeromyxobacter sp.]|nr:hypothetical protein [Anaeromyxobacter sp.]